MIFFQCCYANCDLPDQEGLYRSYSEVSQHSQSLAIRGMEDLCRYQLKEEYVMQFPFSSYSIYETCQGRFYIENEGDCIKSFLASGRWWELHVIENIRRFGKPGSIIIDIGAHIGTHTVEMSRVVGKKGFVIAFEPQKKIGRELLKNLELNECLNVLHVQCVLGKEEGFSFLGPENVSNEGSRYVSKVQLVEQVPMRTLDSFQLNDVSLIKIDVENMEKEVLEGARETIERNLPVLLIEVMGNFEKAFEENVDMDVARRGVIEMIQDFGYEVHHLYLHDYIAFPFERHITLKNNDEN